MILQELQFPNADTCADYDMYFRTENSRQIYYDPRERAVHIKGWQGLCFDTYFNCFSAAKWRKYTALRSARLQLELKGTFSVTLMNQYLMNDKICSNVIEERVCRMKERDTVEFDVPFQKCDHGIICFTLRTLDGNDNVFYGGRYVTDADERDLNPVDIAIDICTFRREAFVERNIALLNKTVIDNPDSPLHGHLDVFVSDNGKTLDAKRLGTRRVHIFPNKNVGGAGGFARGMIEIMNFRSERAFSHVLLMDDDVLINPDALVRTYRLLQFLKPEYAGKTIAGAMLRLDRRYKQHECCGWWDCNAVRSCKSNLNLRRQKNILLNEREDEPNFNAWWYSCVPMSKISDENLPMPLFIRYDDVEFGLRTGSDVLSMSGICLWHEPFEFKYSSSIEYYHMRNGLIVNSLHRPGYNGKAAAKRMKDVIRKNLVRYRYKNCELIFRAVEDFLQGADFLLRTDGEKLHGEIMAASEKFLPMNQLDVQFDDEMLEDSFDWDENKLQYLLRVLTFNSLLLPARGVAVVDASINAAMSFNGKAAVLNCDVYGNRGFVTRRDVRRTIATLLRAEKLGRKLAANYARVSQEYRDARNTFASRAFWNRYLNLGESAEGDA